MSPYYMLTRSCFAVNIYGYCGTSSVQEFAGGVPKGLLLRLDPVDRLRTAVWIAKVVDIHVTGALSRGGGAINTSKEDAANERSGVENGSAVAVPMPPLIHNNINMDNVLLVRQAGE